MTTGRWHDCPPAVTDGQVCAHRSCDNNIDTCNKRSVHFLFRILPNSILLAKIHQSVQCSSSLHDTEQVEPPGHHHGQKQLPLRGQHGCPGVLTGLGALAASTRIPRGIITTATLNAVHGHLYYWPRNVNSCPKCNGDVCEHWANSESFATTAEIISRQSC